MEDIKGLKDIYELILSADYIEPDTSSSSTLIIPIYDITAEEFLDFAKNSITTETKEGTINAVSNLKRALDCEMDLFFESINIKKFFDKHNLKFETKSKFLSDIGLFPVYSINKLNKMRNKLEHEYKIPPISDLYTYYELVWNIVKIIDLQLELLYTNGEINMTLYTGKYHYYFEIKHEIEHCGFQIKITDWDKRPYPQTKALEIYLKTKENTKEFINAFKFYLLTIKYYNYGNVNLYKNKVNDLINKLNQKEDLWKG